MTPLEMTQIIQFAGVMIIICILSATLLRVFCWVMGFCWLRLHALFSLK